MDASEAASTKDEEWDGFARRRWANGYALMFALLFGPSVALTCVGLDISRYGRGQDVVDLVIGMFVLITAIVGLFVGKTLAWRLDARPRWATFGITVMLGCMTVAGAWMLFRGRS